MTVPDEEERRRIFRSIVDSDALDLFRQGRPQEALARMTSLAGLPQKQ
jgi:hypothetical protein